MIRERGELEMVGLEWERLKRVGGEFVEEGFEGSILCFGLTKNNSISQCDLLWLC
jgi:hypothetical protein